MSNLQSVIDRLARVKDTGRPVSNSEILGALIAIAEAVQVLERKTDDNYRATTAGQDTMSL